MKVPAQKIDQAYEKWFATYISLQKGVLVHTVSIWNDFWTFLSGYKNSPGRSFDGEWYYNVTPEMNRKLVMVLGPYCKTIMRMWFLRRTDNGDQ